MLGQKAQEVGSDNALRTIPIMQHHSKLQCARLSAARTLLVALGTVLCGCMALSGCGKKSNPQKTSRPQKPTEKLMHILAEKPAPCREDFIVAAVGLRDYLQSMGIELTVALMPEKEAIVRESDLNPNGLPQNEWTKSGSLIAGAVSRLKSAGLSVCNFLPILHEEFVKHPDKPLFRDTVHLNHLGIGLLGRRYAAWSGWRIGTEDASKEMWLGDCNVTHIRRYQEEKGFGHPRVLWRNASANQMAHEASMLEKAELDGVRKLVWLVESSYLEKCIFPPVAKEPRHTQNDQKTYVAAITKVSRLPADLGAASPYPDAITVIEFRAADNTVFMGLTFAMRAHVVDEAVQKEWLVGGQFRLTLTPWEVACRETPGIKNVRQLDDQANFTAPRYWISHWQRLD